MQHKLFNITVTATMLSILAQCPSLGKEWRVFPLGEDGSDRVHHTVRRVVSDTPPVPGVHCPAGSTVLEFVAADGDKDRHNYELKNGRLVHIVPAPSEPDTVLSEISDFLVSEKGNLEISEADYLRAERISAIPDKTSRDAAWQALKTKLGR